MLRKLMLISCVLVVTFVTTPAVSFTQSNLDDWEKKHKKYLRKKREETFTKTIDKLYKMILSVDQYHMKEDSITDPEKLIEAYDKYVSKTIGEPTELIWTSDRVSNFIQKRRVSNRFVLNKIISMYFNQKSGIDTFSISFWNEILSFLFSYGDKKCLQWAFLTVDELNLEFNKRSYISDLDSYNIGPLTAEDYVYDQLRDFRYELYRDIVPLMGTKEFKPIASMILSNIYYRVFNDVFIDYRFDRYVDLVKKYVKLPEYMLKNMPKDVDFEDRESRIKLNSYFKSIFELLPKAEWDTKKQKFIFPKSLQTQPQTQPADIE